ncbi:MAG: hypothetical protein NZ561_12605, partial [Phycisphaerae bacterium]|nr:hypothetical protein [Phycisphaerae bacterium]
IAARAREAARSRADAESLVSERLTEPLLETTVARLNEDPIWRAELIEPVVARRLSRWPIISALHSTLGPLIEFARRSIGPAAEQTPSLASTLTLDGTPLPRRIMTTFARLHSTIPGAARHLETRRLWDESAATAAAADLHARLSRVRQYRRQALLEGAGGKPGWLAPIGRSLLTVGAVLWFPLIQPFLQALLSAVSIRSFGDLAKIIVEILGAGHLLRAGAFLVLWFVVLWLMLRWTAQRRAERLLNRWQSRATTEPLLSYEAQVLDWADSLLQPLRESEQSLAELSRREQELRRRCQEPVPQGVAA